MPVSTATVKFSSDVIEEHIYFQHSRHSSLSTACVIFFFRGCVHVLLYSPCHVAFPSFTQVKARTISAGDCFLVLASDGVWEFMDNKEASYVDQFFCLLANRGSWDCLSVPLRVTEHLPACDEASVRTSSHPRLSTQEPNC